MEQKESPSKLDRLGDQIVYSIFSILFVPMFIFIGLPILIFLHFFPYCPRAIVRKYRKMPFSHANLASYVQELSEHPRFEPDPYRHGGGGGLAFPYHMLAYIARNYAADELRFRHENDRVELDVLREGELAITGNKLMWERGQAMGIAMTDIYPVSDVARFRAELPEIVRRHPIIKRWCRVVTDTPSEFVVTIGPKAR